MNIKKIAVTVFNLFVIGISVALIVYFCISDNGLSDLLKSDIHIHIIWIVLALVCQLGGMLIDSTLNFLFIRQTYPDFHLINGIQSSFIGSFFSAVTPSASGGQPAQLVFLSRKHIEIGFATSCLTQKFVIFQMTSTILSIFALIIRFDFFVSVVNIPFLWICLIFGFVSQIFTTALVSVISFSEKISEIFVRISEKLLKKIRFIKNPEDKISSLQKQVALFHSANRNLLKKPKLMLLSSILIFIQILFIFLIPYCIYRSFSLEGTSVLDMLCSQSFVSISSAMIPLPGATGASELAFSAFFEMFFGKMFLKSALLIWRTITYYGVIILCFPFSFLNSKKENV